MADRSILPECRARARARAAGDARGSRNCLSPSTKVRPREDFSSFNHFLMGKWCTTCVSMSRTTATKDVSEFHRFEDQAAFRLSFSVYRSSRRSKEEGQSSGRKCRFQQGLLADVDCRESTVASFYRMQRGSGFISTEEGESSRGGTGEGVPSVGTPVRQKRRSIFRRRRRTPYM